MSFNMFSNCSTGPFQGVRVCAFDRNTMLNGGNATAQCFPSTGAGLTGVGGSMLPSDLDGSMLPPSGAPNYYLNMWNSNTLHLWQFHVDWPTPGNSYFRGPTNVLVGGYTAACNGGTCIPQLGTGQQLASLADRLMYRLPYRNFSDHDALVATHSVGSPSGIRWYEIRSPGPNPVVYQQAPSHRTAAIAGWAVSPWTRSVTSPSDTAFLALRCGRQSVTQDECPT